MNMIQRLLFVTVLMFLVAPLAVHGTLVSDDKVTFDPALAVTNFNQFKTNIDKAQEFLISIYKGAYGGLSALWFYYSFWMVLSAFYYSFGVSYLNARDDAEAELKKQNEIQRAFEVAHVDMQSIISKLRYLHEKATNKVGDSCYKRGLCEMRSYFATTQAFKWIPRWVRKVLHLEPQSREAGTCSQIHASCTVTSLLASLIQ